MAPRKYNSQSAYQAVEVSDVARALVARVSRQTRIPKRHVVDMALRDYLPKRFAAELT